MLCIYFGIWRIAYIYVHTNLTIGYPVIMQSHTSIQTWKSLGNMFDLCFSSYGVTHTYFLAWYRRIQIWCVDVSLSLSCCINVNLTLNGHKKLPLPWAETVQQTWCLALSRHLPARVESMIDLQGWICLHPCRQMSRKRQMSTFSFSDVEVFFFRCRSFLF